VVELERGKEKGTDCTVPRYATWCAYSYLELGNLTTPVHKRGQEGLRWLEKAAGHQSGLNGRCKRIQARPIATRCTMSEDD
jgi:hypothetical protein